ncbi:MAG: hypothetical protein Q6358_00365 [Candidatus Brocadiales bacterium]|nr:hypothetical protein [Candidatus Brocadiales bacterium]
MKTSEIITLIVSSIGGSAALFGVVAWLATSLIKHFLEKDLVDFKLKLERISFEHQIRFSKLHEIRAQIIAELYGRLYEFHWAVCGFLRDFHRTNHGAKRIRELELDKKLDDFKDYFDKHRIYFTANICFKIDELVNSLYSSYVPLMTVNTETDHNDSEVRHAWTECAEIVRNKYPEIRKSLESDFRNILGVIENREELNK